MRIEEQDESERRSEIYRTWEEAWKLFQPLVMITLSGRTSALLTYPSFFVSFPLLFTSPCQDQESESENKNKEDFGKAMS